MKKHASHPATLKIDVFNLGVDFISPFMLYVKLLHSGLYFYASKSFSKVWRRGIEIVVNLEMVCVKNLRYFVDQELTAR